MIGMQRFHFTTPLHWIVGIALALICSGTSAADISWELRNPFRLFEYAQGPNAPAEMWQEYRPNGSLTESYGRLTTLGSPIYRKGFESPWIESEGLHLVQHYKPEYYQRRPKYEIKATLTGVRPGAKCVWTINQQTVLDVSDCADAKLTLRSPAAALGAVADDGTIGQLPITIRQRNVIGLGDSYASGEGNPDVPSKFGEPTKAMVQKARPSELKEFWLDQLLKEPARWWDTTCNRSFWSYQVQTVLRLADAYPQSDWVAGIYSCAGAETFDGLLYPQASPPGIPADCASKHVDMRLCSAPESQFNAMVDDLCPQRNAADEKPIDPKFLPLQWRHIDFYKRPRDRSITVQSNDLRIHKCGPGNQIPIDLLLLSAGGNDIGFSGVIFWAMFPGTAVNVLGRLFHYDPVIIAQRRDSSVCPNPAARRVQACDTTPGRSASERLERLGSNSKDGHLDALAWAFDELGIQGNRVVINAYPNPLFQADGKSYCRDADNVGQPGWRQRGEKAPTIQAAWDAFAQIAYNQIYNRKLGAIHNSVKLITRVGGFRFPATWDFDLLPEEAEIIDSDGRGDANIANRLNEVVRTKAAQSRWTFVDNQLAVEAHHGWCSVGPGEQIGDLRLYAWPGFNSDGEPGDITQWKPYVSRGRWFRTANDSVMTQWARSDMRSDGIAGTFHPTAQSHAYAADAVFDAVKNIPPL